MTTNLNNKRRLTSQRGMTLIELIVACAILVVLCSVALPIARYTGWRMREKELRQDLRDMRDAIDHYKTLADKGQIRVDPLAGGYPPDLETLVKGVPLTGAAGQSKTIHFLRRIPTDPITKQADWGLRSVEDDPDSTSWDGKNVFDVYSKSDATAMDGTKYSEW
jgi:general secretion pathway protein G